MVNQLSRRSLLAGAAGPRRTSDLVRVAGNRLGGRQRARRRGWTLPEDFSLVVLPDPSSR